MDEAVKIKFYFSNGKDFCAVLRQQDFDDLVSRLRNNWDNTIFTSENIGVRFSHVTHYIAINYVEAPEPTGCPLHIPCQSCAHETVVPSPRSRGNCYE